VSTGRITGAIGIGTAFRTDTFTTAVLTSNIPMQIGVVPPAVGVIHKFGLAAL